MDSTLRPGTSTRNLWLLRAEATTSHSMSRTQEETERCKFGPQTASGGSYSSTPRDTSRIPRTERHLMLWVDKTKKVNQLFFGTSTVVRTNNGTSSTPIRVERLMSRKLPTIMVSKQVDHSTSCQECQWTEFFNTQVVTQWRSPHWKTTTTRDNNGSLMHRLEQSPVFNIHRTLSISWVMVDQALSEQPRPTQDGSKCSDMIPRQAISSTRKERSSMSAVQLMPKTDK